MGHLAQAGTAGTLQAPAGDHVCMIQRRLQGPVQGQQQRSCWPRTSNRPNGPARPSSLRWIMHTRMSDPS
eukprot:NODE_6064_length_656_cov_7.261944_g5142_i0.p4 GENE.NODE_6064_length_656_cov_7.261944_g5142_i0~~NODE_6064_length_656_cov_7.261944_g5142_i0.p4  ORF type:complete len:70 (+),score=4.53 NODE_6064_length_656_cov_7.261944_g5142_i0:85-294(+)